VPTPRLNVVERTPGLDERRTSQRLVNGVPMPRLCARLAAWADEQGLSATGGAGDLTGAMTARFWLAPRWWVQTGIGAGSNLRGGADLIDPRQLGIATLHRTGYELQRTEHTTFELRANVSTVTLSARQVALTFDLAWRIF